MNTGILVSVIIFLWGIWALFEKKLAMETHPVFAEIYLAIISAMFIPIYLFLGKYLNLNFQFSKSAVFWAFLAQLCGIAGGILFLFLLSQKSAYWVVAVTSAYPIITLVLAALFFRESISVYSMIGVALISGGLVFLNLK